MNLNKKLAVAVSGAVLLMAGQFALADSTTDIVDALVSKGVLTEEEGKLISKGAKSQKEAQDKAIKGKLSISGALDNATLYGDMRARYERRDAKASETANLGKSYESNRSRYKLTLGVETKSGDWYSDIAAALSNSGRSDNVTFGNTAVTNAMSPKDSGTLYIKRAMIGWNATPWLSVEAGRMKNPLYTTSMVFDADIVTEGLQEKLKFKLSDSTELFGNLGQWVYSGAGVQATNDVVTSGQRMVWAFQAGVNQAFIDNKASGKAAVSLYSYASNLSNTPFNPGLETTVPTGTTYVAEVVGNNTAGSAKPSVKAVAGVTGLNTYGASINDLNILEIPAELNYMATDNIGVRVYGDYANNLSGSDRYKAACAYTAKTKDAAGAAQNDADVCGLGDDHTAWLVGLSVGSAKDLKAFEGKKMRAGDWNANLWYQSVGAYALDPNAVDSDIFDSRVNMEGVIFKGQYNIADNVFLNFTGGHANRKNKKLGAGGAAGDIAHNLDDYSLYQFDVNYKF
jgi:polyhydroxyalkanoate synthesis regulator phasin